LQIRNKNKDAKEENMRSEWFDVGEYVDLMALLLDLQLRDEYRDGVVANFERIMAIANLVNEFPLTEEIEITPVFEP
jgi:hypothetical protein